MTASQVTVYNPMGIALADLDVDVYRSWVLNGPGEANFTISTKDNKCREEYLRYGNRLLVQHTDLPDWVGFIDTPRLWSYGRVEVNAVGAETWFDWRVTNIGAVHDSLAEVFRWIIDDCNHWGGSQMKYGEIKNGGIDAVAALGGKATDHIQRIVEKWGVDWSVTSRISKNNRLELYANLYDGLRGKATQLVLNHINSRITDPIVTEDGAIWNHVFYYSEPGEGGSRVIGDSRDHRSEMLYDLRQIAEQGVGAYEPGLEFAAWMRLQETKEPVIMVAPAVLNINEAWKSLRLGNFINWDSDYVGFDNSTVGMASVLRIVGMEYADKEQAVTLVAELAERHYTRKELINLALSYTGERAA